MNIIFQNIQLLACFFFWTSSTSNLYLAIQSSCRKEKREVRTVTSTVAVAALWVAAGACSVACAQSKEEAPCAFPLPRTSWNFLGHSGWSAAVRPKAKVLIGFVSHVIIMMILTFNLRTLIIVLILYSFITTRHFRETKTLVGSSHNTGACRDLLGGPHQSLPMHCKGGTLPFFPRTLHHQATELSGLFCHLGRAGSPQDGGEGPHYSHMITKFFPESILFLFRRF